MKNPLQIRIERLSKGGDGVGHLDGKVCFVPESAPGDLLEIQITQDQKRFSRGRILKIIEPGPERIQPHCSVYGQCGGCNWQHISYAEQVSQKTQLLEREARRLNPDVHGLPFVPSPREWGYRRRIQVTRDHEGRVGYRQRHSHKLVPTSTCPIADPRVNALLQELSRNPTAAPGRYELRVDSGGRGHCDHLSENVSAFSQVNEGINQILKNTVIQRTLSAQPARVIELYCGSGNFTFPLREALPGHVEISAVEEFAPSLNTAKAKAQAVGGTDLKLKFHQMKSVEFLKRETESPGTTVLLDPPRGGLETGVIPELIRLNPRQILYVSCDLATLFRDLGALLGASKMRLVSVQGLDMFPQTDHFEVLAELVQN